MIDSQEKQQLVQLAYCSTSTKLMLPAELDELLSIAIRNNTKANVTGLLVYSGGSFFQWLEGPESSVDRLLNKILADKRHKNCTVLFREHSTERAFYKWAMAYATSSDLDEVSKEGFVALKDIQSGESSMNASSAIAKTIVRSFARNNPN